MHRLTFVLLSMFFTGCMTAHVLPPRAAPPAVMPAVSLPSEPPPPQHGRVVIDVTDGAMDVVAQRNEPFGGTSPSAAGVGGLCRTPCVRDLPLGRYDLFFSGLQQDESRGDRAPLEVHEGVNVLLRAPGKYETPRAFQPGPFALIMGGLALGATGSLVQPAVGGEAGGALAISTALVGLGMIVTGMVIYHLREEVCGSRPHDEWAHLHGRILERVRVLGAGRLRLEPRKLCRRGGCCGRRHADAQQRNRWRELHVRQPLTSSFLKKDPAADSDGVFCLRDRSARVTRRRRALGRLRR